MQQAWTMLASLRSAAKGCPLPVKILRIAADFVSGAEHVRAALDRLLPAPGAAPSPAK